MNGLTIKESDTGLRCPRTHTHTHTHTTNTHAQTRLAPLQPPAPFARKDACGCSRDQTWDGAGVNGGAQAPEEEVEGEVEEEEVVEEVSYISSHTTVMRLDMRADRGRSLAVPTMFTILPRGAVMSATNRGCTGGAGSACVRQGTGWCRVGGQEKMVEKGCHNPNSPPPSKKRSTNLLTPMHKHYAPAHWLK